MRRSLVSLAVVTLFALVPMSGGSIRAHLSAQDPIDLAGQASVVDESTDLWFVEMPSPPTADGTSAATVTNEKAEFRRAAAQAGLRFQERFAFNTLWNGLSIRISPSDVPQVRRLPGVNDVYPVESIPLPEPGNEGYDPQLMTAELMTGVAAAHAAGFTGKGVKVAIMDTGIDYRHPDLGGCFGPGCRVETGWDYVGDAFTGSQVPVPDDDPMDCYGHGTHVAGIVGAHGGITGVAPDVTFGAYRVFGCSGSTTQDIMIAAMERALADGMQVLNMSIGSAAQWPQRANAQASTRLVNKGVVVVASAGNDSSYGLYGSAAPSVGTKVISVASFNNSHTNQRAFQVSSAGATDQLIGFNSATSGGAETMAPGWGTYDLARTGTTTSTADACTALSAGSLTGKVVLIRRSTTGGCNYYQKAINAQNAGAVGVILYNTSTSNLTPSIAGTPAVGIPVVGITSTNGAAIDTRIQTGTARITWTDRAISTISSSGGQIASSSSWGLSPDLALKPDIAAPGGNILSTYLLASGGYTSMSGTSMSSPHVVGAAALLLEARPHAPAQAVRTILQNSAVPQLNPSLNQYYPVHRQGAGMLDIESAIFSTTRIEPGKLSLGESEFGPATRTLTIENEASTDVVYDLSHVGALSTGPSTFSITQLAVFATVAFAVPSVTVPAHGEASVDVTIAPPAALADQGLYGGYLVFTPRDGGAVSRVPYAGFKGDYQSMVILSRATEIRRRTGTASDGTGIYSPSPVGDIFTMTDAFNVPYVYVHLNHQARRLRLEVFDALTGKSWHRARDTQFVGHSSTSSAYSAYSWDGTTTAGKKVYLVPNGQYIIVMSLLKPLGDENNPAHWETWTSPWITIQR
jgi:subtilisin family serine protease